MRYHYVSLRITKIQNNDKTTCCQGYKETGLFIHCWWECKMENSLAVSYIIKHEPTI